MCLFAGPGNILRCCRDEVFQVDARDDYVERVESIQMGEGSASSLSVSAGGHWSRCRTRSPSAECEKDEGLESTGNKSPVPTSGVPGEKIGR